MKLTLPPAQLTAYLARQLDHFFPDGSTATELELARAISHALERFRTILSAVKAPLFHRGGEPWFNHLNSDQSAIFLYLLANEIGTKGGSAEVASKLYLLNKALHGIDVFYEVRLPRLFLFFHPVGTVLGRATYADRFIVMQQCTIGNIRSEYPRFGEGVALCAGASVLGGAHVGRDVCFGAGSLLLGGEVPANTTVTGRAKDVRFTPARAPFWADYFQPAATA